LSSWGARVTLGKVFTHRKRGRDKKVPVEDGCRGLQADLRFSPGPELRFGGYRAVGLPGTKQRGKQVTTQGSQGSAKKGKRLLLEGEIRGNSQEQHIGA